MNEAPKKIWVNDDWNKHPYWHAKENRMTTTQYIRADLVDGLVDLLKQDLEWMENGDEVGYGGDLYNKIKAALKAMEEE